MKTSDLNAVVASVPLNKTAARVMSRGVHYERERKELPQQHRVDTRASVDPLPVDPSKAPPYAKAIVGRKFGRWLVLGFAVHQPRSGKAAWVVKCGCGRYEQRTLRAIKRAPRTDDCCWECQSLKHAKKTYRELGAKPLSTFVAEKL